MKPIWITSFFPGVLVSSLWFYAPPGQETKTLTRATSPLVTLKAENSTLASALSAFEKQTGVSVLDDRGEPDRKVTFKVEKVPFWQALDVIAASADGLATPYGPAGRLALVRKPDGFTQPPTSYSGQFRITLKRIAAARDFESGKGNCTVNMEVAWAPTLLPLFLETQPQDLRLLDDKMKAVPVSSGGSSLGDLEGKPALAFDVALPALPRTSTKIGLLEGRLAAIAPTKMVSFSFASLADLEKTKPDDKERNKTIAGATARVDKLTLVRDRWTIRVTVTMPKGGQTLESFQASAWLANNEMVLVGKDGKRKLRSGSYVIENCSSRRATLSYHFVDKPGVKRGKAADWMLTYTSPALIVEVSIPFRFKDVPLP
jgi:hypothetical protein